MDDLTELADSLAASVGDVRGSLIVSRDGLVLGASPAGAEGLVKPAWVRFAALGEPERGFVQFGTEAWCYARRGAYAIFVVAGTTVRPGLVLDQIDQALLVAEDARARRDVLRAPEPPPPAAPAPSSKPRTPLHPETRPADRPAVTVRPEPPTAEVRADEASVASPPAVHAEQMVAPRSPEHPDGTTEGPGDVWATERDAGEEEIDRFSLAREFSQLLQEDRDGADG